MTDKTYIVITKILASFMFLYGSLLCIFSLPIMLIYDWTIFSETNHLDSKFLLLPLVLVLLGMLYSIAGFGMLRLKPWGRVLSIYGAGLAIILSIAIWVTCIYIIGLSARYAPFDIQRAIFTSLFVIFLYLVMPALFILIFFTRSRIKTIFKERTIQESKGITIFAALFIMFFLMILPWNYWSSSLILKIHEPYRHVYFWLISLLNIIGLFTAIGLFTLKDTFRKIAILLALFNLIVFIFEPTFVSALEPALIVLVILFFIYNIAFVYFFTRGKIKEQFK